MNDRGRLLSGGPAGTAAALALVIPALLAASTPGLAEFVSVGYLAVAPLLAWRLARRNPAGFLVFVLWLWLVTPEVRRIANFTDGWSPDDPIMAAPGIASLAAVRGLVGRRLPHGAEPLLAMLAALAYGSAVGVLQAGLSATAAGVVYWLPPPLIGLLAMTDALPPRELRDALRHLAVWGSLVVGVYGLIQFVALPEWDAKWMVDTKLTTIGSPEPEKVRVFSTLNSPGPLGVILSGMLIVLSASRSRLAIAAAVVAVPVLGLSQVRSGWVGWAAGLLALAIFGRARGRRGLALAAIPIVVLGFFGGAVEQTIRDRFDQTAEAGTSDDSLTARIRFHRAMVPRALRDPVGNGIGSTGVASDQATAGADSLGSFDGAIPESLFALGVFGGTVYLGAFALLVRNALRRTRSGGAFAASTVALAVQVLFGNPLIAGSGVLLMVVAVAAARSAERSPPAGVAGSSVARLAPSRSGTRQVQRAARPRAGR